MLEMAIFGSLILLVFGALLSYLQRQNDQQYVEMETFRRSLQKGNSYQGQTQDGAGASVQLTFLEDRINVAAQGGFKKGSPSTANSSSSVFWAVPKSGAKPDNLIVYRINEDESPALATGTQVEGITSSSDTTFSENLAKTESPQQITTRRESDLSSVITHQVLGAGGAPVWQVTQGLYKDADGQYHYGSGASGNVVHSEKEWSTDF